MGDAFVDEYSHWRTAPDAARLCYQHFLWRELYRMNIHPAIKLDKESNLRILEVASGHCMWAVQVAEEYPNSNVVASDIDLGLSPPTSELPKNVSVVKWNFFEKVPEDWQNAFDLIHVRLIVQPFAGNQDPRPTLAKFVSMLRPGGYLQWGEYNYEDVKTGHVYAVSDPELVPNPEITHSSSVEMWQMMHNQFEWPIAHFAKLEQYYRDAGLDEVEVHRARPPRAIFRAFHEHWYAICAQLLPVFEKKGVGAEANQLVRQIRRGAEDGVFSAHIAKFVIGKKPEPASTFP